MQAGAPLLQSKTDQLFTKKQLHPKQHPESKIVRLFYDTFLKTLWWNHSISGGAFEIVEVLDNLTVGKYKFDKSSNWKKHVSDLIPALKNNETWLDSLQTLVSCTMKGVGVGEMFMTLVDPKAKFTGEADFISGVTEYEIKKATGGCLKGNFDARHKVVDGLRRDIGIPKVKKIEKIEVDFYTPFGKLSKDKRKDFFTTLYPNMNKDRIQSLVSLSNLPIEDQRFAHGHEVLKEYKDIDGFDNMMLISDEQKPFIIHISDMNDVSFLKQHVSFTPKVARGGDTNAVGDGYATIQAINNKS